MKIIAFLIVLVALIASIQAFFINKQEADEFFNEKRSIMYGHGREQRREAKENYEEKCERNVINQAMNKPRWCPELNTWPLWTEATKKDH